MTKKQLQITKERYRDYIKKNNISQNRHMQFGTILAIAESELYNHHERGQRLWAFIEALKEEGGV